MKFPDEHGTTGIDNLLKHDKMGFLDLPVHVAEDALNGGDSPYLVERILEERIRAVILGETGDAFGRKFVEEADQSVDVHLSLR